MFTQICNLRLLPLGLIMGLAGCAALPGIPFLTPADPVQTRPELVLDDGFVVRGPYGYCITPESPRMRRATTLVTLASCVSLAKEAGFDPTDGRLLTVSRSDIGAQDLTNLRSYIQSDLGQGALASDGDSAGITIHQIEKTRVAIYIDYSDTGRAEKLGQRSWKGFLNLGGQLVILGVNAGFGPSVAGQGGEDLIRDLAAELLRANPD